jgi:hypothetical protein
VDGVCCNTACNTACLTCAKAGSPGTCTNVASGAADPRSLCVGECASGCTGTGCSYKPATTPCSLSCLGNQLTSGGRCAGTSEKCSGAATAPCAGGLLCADGLTCKTACTTGADCVSGVCDTTTGTCSAPPVDAGPPDTGAPDTEVTPDTSIVDSEPVVDVLPIADAPAPVVEAVPKLPISVQACANDAECPSGHCVEGVCCDTACTDRCHSCALLASPGKCTLEPIGVDLKQECGPAYTCLGTCGAGGECIGAGKGTMCARNRCTGPSKGVGPAYCESAGGKCNDDGVSFDCSPFTCAPAFGACLTTCASSLDCANGFVCDFGSKTCVAPPAPAEDSGCSVGSSRTGAASWLVALAALAMARAARSRPRSPSRRSRHPRRA